MTEDRPLKILLMGDASNYHNALATGLSRLGHDVTVASSGSGWMNTDRGIDLTRREGKVGGAVFWIKFLTRILPKMKGYDVVSIKNPIFLELRPEKILYTFDYLKRHNRRVFLTALGTDTPYVDMCTASDSPLRYSEWRVGGHPAPYAIAHPETEQAWKAPLLRNHCSAIYKGIDGAVTALYEYDLACRRVLPDNKVAYAGIPIDTASIVPVELPDRPDKVKFFLGMHKDRLAEKGTDRLMAAARRVVDKYPARCSLDIVENVPYKEYLGRLRSAHVVIDQLYSYTPATNALLAMAMGLNAVSGAEPEYYGFLGERNLRPVINAVPDDETLSGMFEKIVMHPELIRRRGIESRQFVERHNDTEVVGRRFLSFWEKCIYGNGNK